MNREEAKKRIIDGALTWMEKDIESGEPPMHWTADELNAALTDMKWNDGFPIDFDLGLLANSINRVWMERHPVSAVHSEEKSRDEPVSDEDAAPNGTPYFLPIAGMDGYSVDPYP